MANTPSNKQLRTLCPEPETPMTFATPAVSAAPRRLQKYGSKRKRTEIEATSFSTPQNRPLSYEDTTVCNRRSTKEVPSAPKKRKTSIPDYFATPKSKTANQGSEENKLDAQALPSPPYRPLPAGKPKQRSPRKLTTRPNFTMSTISEERSALQDVSANNTQPAAPCDREDTPRPYDDSQTAKPPTKKRKLISMIQTIIASSRPVRIECKECGLVYNKLAENDIKIHKQRHQSWLQKKLAKRSN